MSAIPHSLSSHFAFQPFHPLIAYQMESRGSSLSQLCLPGRTDIHILYSVYSYFCVPEML